MLIIALQDDVDNLYAIWNTVTDRFLNVNLTKDEAIKTVMDYKGCSIEEATSKVEHPQPFSDIASAICDSDIMTKFNMLRARCREDVTRDFDNGNYDKLQIVGVREHPPDGIMRMTIPDKEENSLPETIDGIIGAKNYCGYYFGKKRDKSV